MGGWLFEREIRNRDHVIELWAHPSEHHGWSVGGLLDSRVVRVVACRDWHRAERALASLEQEITALVRLDWATGA